MQCIDIITFEFHLPILSILKAGVEDINCGLVMDEPRDVYRDEHYEPDLKILKFIFNRVNEDIVDLNNATILTKLREAGLMSEKDHQSVISCLTNSDKNK